jgi:hypothetical protein
VDGIDEKMIAKLMDKFTHDYGKGGVGLDYRKLAGL